MPTGGNEAEWLTRKKRIDRRLRSDNPSWQIIRCRDGLDLSSLHCVAVEEFPTTSRWPSNPKTPLTLPEVIENIWQNVDRDYHVRILGKRLLRIDKDMNTDANNAKGRVGFVMVNVPKNGHSCSVKITEDVRKYAAGRGVSKDDAFKKRTP